MKHNNLSKNLHFRQKFALPHFGTSFNRIPSTQLIIHGHVLWNPLFQVRNQIVRFAMAQLSCSFTSLCGNKCDISWPGQQQLVPLSSCVDSIKEHLRDVKVSQTSVASEKELILLRVKCSVGLFDASDGHVFTICPKHGVELGVRPTTKCQHPLHGNQRRKVERGINLKMAKDIKARWNAVVPVGAGILD